MLCALCQNVVTTTHLWRRKVYCSKECRHAAGDRSVCVGWNCGCTKYAKKRRLLNEHREEMRYVRDFIIRYEMDDTYDVDMDKHYRTELSLKFDAEIDEDSDQEDPEQALREALAKSNEALVDKSSFVEAATGILENRGLAVELERSRMQMEDFRAQLIRKQ